MRGFAILLIPFFFLLAGRVQAAENFPSSRQAELSPGLVDWMAERYSPNTLLGLNWKGSGKAEAAKAAGRTWTPVAGLGAPGGSRPSRRLDFSPPMFNTSADTYIESDTYDLRFTSLGGGTAAGWAVGYSNVSEVDKFEDWYRYETKADVFYAAMMFSPGAAAGMAPYLFLGGARVAYVRTETDYDISGDPTSARYSETAYTWTAGFGLSLMLPEMPVGLFFEAKMIPESGNFYGLYQMLLGISLSI